MTRSVHYKPFLSLALRHGYYTGGTARSLTLAPTAITANVLSGHLCRLRATPGLAEIWYAEETGIAPALDLPDGTILGFTLPSSDPDFFVVTEPVWPGELSPDDCLYLSNKGRTADDPVSLPATGATVLPARPRGFPRPEDASGRLSLVRWFDDTAVWQEPQGLPPAAPINLSDVTADGRYLLMADDAVVLDFYLTALPAAQVPIALELGWAPPRHAADLPRRAEIGVDARRGTWVYHVASSDPLEETKPLRIVDAEGNSPFGEGVVEKIGGSPAVTFRSLAPLDIRESYSAEDRLMLEIHEAGTQAPKTIPLPLAGPGNIAKRQDRFAFEMYVTL